MNKAQAHSLLNALRAGESVSEENILRALKATGDLSIVHIRSDGKPNGNAVGPCRAAVSHYLMTGGRGTPKNIAKAVGFPLKAVEHAIRKLRLADSPLMVRVMRESRCGRPRKDEYRPPLRPAKDIVRSAIKTRSLLELAWAA